MGGASAYLWMFFLCFVVVGALVGLGAFLYVLGKRRERGGAGGRATSASDQDAFDDLDPRDAQKPDTRPP